jgi:hypothetical protein
MDSLKPDFCPQINLVMDMEFGKKRMSGLVLHKNKLCVAKKLNTKSFLYNIFNSENNKEKKTHLMKVHKMKKKSKKNNNDTL